MTTRFDLVVVMEAEDGSPPVEGGLCEKLEPTLEIVAKSVASVVGRAELVSAVLA